MQRTPRENSVVDPARIDQLNPAGYLDRVNVSASARLHFGLSSCSTHSSGQPLFGGIGAMIDSPALSVSIERADKLSFAGGPIDRVQWFYERWKSSAKKNEFTAPADTPCRITVDNADQHLGLGTGTRLGLAMGTALNSFYGIHDQELVELAQSVDRGNRSAIGIHGFAHGGFIYDRGKKDPQSIGELGFQMNMPESWRVVVGIAGEQPGFSGQREIEVFSKVADRANGSQTDLRELVCQNVLPALKAADFASFSAAIFEYGFQSGLIFAEHQGGPYNGEQMTEIINWLRANRVVGVGQSSWGPAFYALAESESAAVEIRDSLIDEFGLSRCWVSSFAKTGATITATNNNNNNNNNSETPIQPNI